MRNSTLLAMAVAAAMALTGCSKDIFSSSGKEVRFTAESTSATATKTAYSGKYEDIDPDPNKEKNIERIDWIAGDQIVIWSDKARTRGGAAWATYNIMESTITPYNSDGIEDEEGRYSRANIEVSSPESGLQWGEGSHLFLGLYPAPTQINGTTNAAAKTGVWPTGAQGFMEEYENNSLTAVTFSTVQPNVQDGKVNMNYAYLLAMEELSKPTGNNKVILSFKPIFTAFEFRIRDAENKGIKLKELKLIADKDLCGEDIIEIEIDDDDDEIEIDIDHVIDPNNKIITVPYEEPIALPSATKSPHIITVFGSMYDEDYTDFDDDPNDDPDDDPNDDDAVNNYNMKVALTLEKVDGKVETRTLELKARKNASDLLEWIPYPRGKKAIIHLEVLSKGIAYQITVEGQGIGLDHWDGTGGFTW